MARGSHGGTLSLDPGKNERQGGTCVASILYVDDELAIQRAVRTWLTRRGHVVHTAASLAEARRILEQQTVDGVFLDIWLGTESGFELQSWIDDHRPELSRRIVFVTGDIMAEQSIARATEQLGRPLLPKPFELRDLDAHVARWSAGPGFSHHAEASPS